MENSNDMFTPVKDFLLGLIFGSNSFSALIEDMCHTNIVVVWLLDVPDTSPCLVVKS